MDGDATERNRLEAEARRISAEIAADMGDTGDRTATPDGSQENQNTPDGDSRASVHRENSSKSKSRSSSSRSSKKAKKGKKKRRRSSSSSSSSSGGEARSRRKRLPTSQKLKRERWPEGYDTDDVNDLTFREALAMKEVEDKEVRKDRDSLPGVRVARKETKLKTVSIPAGTDDANENLHMAR